MLAPHLATALGQPVVVENRPGAGGNVGTAGLARAEPVASSPEEFVGVIARDIATWRDVVRRAAIQPI